MSERGKGTVLVSYGSHGVVQLDDGRRIECRYRRGVGRPCCGDRVRVSLLKTGEGVVEGIEARDNEFVRGDRHGRRHVIAANLDQVLIVVARRPLPSRDLVERYLVAVHSLQIIPVLVVNKSDIETIDDAHPGAPALSRLDDYRALGYGVLETSCKTNKGTDALADLCRDRTSILVGQSGVGKSSLARSLLPDLDIQTGALSRATGKGTHTTTTTIRYSLPEGGFLVDSPGVWEYGLWQLPGPEIAHGFVEFRPWIKQCRFNDCSHLSEPGCAVKDAVQSGRIRPWRYAAFIRLMAQNVA
ncbi:MAG: ribosome small subunit-dependent GTPase A [Xanthomonadales bacterium]|nr:ribosome small subunit-dependent GTPase A [Xanthomonadales bacterium]